MEVKKQSAIFKALSNPNRLQLYLEILKKNEASYKTDKGCMLAEAIKILGNIGIPTISHHLKELVNAELIITEKRGKNVICMINEKTRQEVQKIFFHTKKKS